MLSHLKWQRNYSQGGRRVNNNNQIYKVLYKYPVKENTFICAFLEAILKFILNGPQPQKQHLCLGEWIMLIGLSLSKLNNEAGAGWKAVLPEGSGSCFIVFVVLLTFWLTWGISLIPWTYDTSFLKI